eukprot:TRINITY_DN25616_c0_g1_i1.p1 TRINITY_DN25616_c0_g1~~TRINITY_DN25616_c0_g1_i1.p1  ORF type:complete len:148 (-),score=14.63 TRINITY_DN25616_c0_g1_i1:37-480(-)
MEEAEAFDRFINVFPLMLQQRGLSLLKLHLSELSKDNESRFWFSNLAMEADSKRFSDDIVVSVGRDHHTKSWFREEKDLLKKFKHLLSLSNPVQEFKTRHNWSHAQLFYSLFRNSSNIDALQCLVLVLANGKTSFCLLYTSPSPRDS